MPTPARRTAPAVDRFLSEVPEPQRAIAAALRTVIRSAAPGLTETMKWGSPSYTGRGNVLYIAAQSSYVNLGLYHGAQLVDPSGRVEGTGKGLRHVKIHTLRDAKSPEVRRLVRAAVRLDAA